ncbi:MAG: type II toxin-antitoxin system VapC family toxin [Lachnospiraceae bacterium]|nr:type II toxin-antitoxin system VapC family toxin [Lachnospiraceae bacterium]
MYLLDTCTFIWYLEDSPQLSHKAREIIRDERQLFLSLTTLWEIAIKKTIHKLDLKESTADLVKICEEDGIVLLPIESRYFDTIQTLPYIHGDPFDRLLIATALDNNLTLLTDDRNIQKYTEIKQVW